MNLENSILLAGAGVLTAVGVAAWRRLVETVQVYEYQAVVHFKEGRIVGQLPVGHHRFLKRLNTFAWFDLRERRLDLSGQEVLTRDGIAVKISLTVTWRVVDAIEVVRQTPDAGTTLYSAVQLELREAVKGIDFEDLLQDRGFIERSVTTPAREYAAGMGLEVQRVALKDLIVSGELKRALSEVVRARAEAKAKLEQTRGETAALRNSINAAKLFEEHAGLKTLRLLETARVAAENDNNTLVLGLSQEARGLDT